MHKVYILCPPCIETGGPEALHQLGYVIGKLGIDVSIVYASGRPEDVSSQLGSDGVAVFTWPEIKNPTPPLYEKYGIKKDYSVRDESGSVVVCPEIWPHLIDAFKSSHKMLWWLSLDYGLGAARERGKESILSDPSITHLYQSIYARIGLLQRGIEKVYPLYDFTPIPEIKPILENKRNIIAYNRKGYVVANQLAELIPDIEFVKIEGMSRAQVFELLGSAKIYIDFGGHMGMDRMPREAALMGCCVITNRQGSANYFEDVTIPATYKHDDASSDLGPVVQIAQDILANFEQHYPNFDPYRAKIYNERHIFDTQVANIFAKVLPGSVTDRSTESDAPSYAAMEPVMNRDQIERAIFGKIHDSFNVDQVRWLTAAISSAAYAEEHMTRAKRFESKSDLIQFCIDESTIDGLVLEFGVFSGSTITFIANKLPNAKVFGFDSFEGLPENWRDEFGKGSFACNLPEVPGNVELIKGWFNMTLPSFVAEHRDEKIKLLHVDCDLYSSTNTVFSELKNQVGAGTIILFDEYFNYPGWELHEQRALHEFCKGTGIFYEYIGLVPTHQQVAIRVLNNPR